MIRINVRDPNLGNNCRNDFFSGQDHAIHGAFMSALGAAYRQALIVQATLIKWEALQGISHAVRLSESDFSTRAVLSARGQKP